MLPDHRLDLAAHDAVGRGRQPGFQDPRVEAERLERSQFGVEARVGEAGRLRGGVKRRHFVDEAAARGHQVVPHRGEFPDVFAAPEHYLVRFADLVLVAEPSDRLEQEKLEPVERIIA